jgi:hypothetical protein
MKPALRLTVIAITATLILALAKPIIVQADTPSLCAYWQPNITKWADLITQYATDNGLDPNLVAAIVEEESKGNSYLVSNAGAVGLMQIMPYEAGFTWRPRAYVLRKPAANLEWGTHTLNEVVRQAQGRITLAVMAYNSGWDRIQLRATRLFAGKVFDHYARCLLSQAGSDSKNVSDYTVYVIANSSAGPTYVDRFRSSGAFEPVTTFDPESLPVDLPHAVAFSQLDEDHIAWWVEVWVDVRPTLGEALSSTAPLTLQPRSK